MINKFFNSFKENINQKTTNPFLGTFIIIWIIRNWEFFYSLFYFDSDFTRLDRLNIIQEYFKEYDLLEILLTILFSFIILISTYILLNLSRLIINFFDKMITPKVYEITDKSSIVLKSDYKILEQQIKSLESKIQDEREQRFKTQNENDILEKRIKELVGRRATLTAKKTTSNKPNSNQQNKIELITNKLIKDKTINVFMEIASDILNGFDLQKTDAVREFTTLGLMTPGVHQGRDEYAYKLTELGMEVHEKIILDELR